MKKFRLWLSVAAILVLATGAMGWFFFNRVRWGVVEGTVVDELSQGPVWHAAIVVDGRSTVKFNSTEFSLRKIASGDYTLKVSAPNYLDVTKPITVKPGQNVVHIAMKGSGVSDLKGILAFAEPLEEGLRIEIRMTDSDGVAITNHPAIKCRLEVALYLREGVEPHYAKGMQLFEGPVDLVWDRQDSLARYKGMITWDKMKIRPKDNQIGMLEAALFTSQGTFTFTNNEVEFSQKVLQ
jgi:Carboxypeptidase regulatory-like domain